MEEIQSHSGVEIIKRKARQAFLSIKKPLIVTDHFWNIEALRGFPGAYMKYMNEWLTPQDFLSLMQPYENRNVYLEEYLYYIDDKQQKLFYDSLKGKVLHDVKGTNEQASRSVISLREDGMSIAECWNKGIDPVEKYELWQEFGAWLHKR